MDLVPPSAHNGAYAERPRIPYRGCAAHSDRRLSRVPGTWTRTSFTSMYREMYQFGEHRAVSVCAVLYRFVRPSPQLDQYVPTRTRTDRHDRYIRFSALGAGGREFESPHPDHIYEESSVPLRTRLGLRGGLSRWRRWLTRSLRLGLGSARPRRRGPGSRSRCAWPSRRAVSRRARPDPARGPSDQHGEHRDRWRGT